MKFWRSLFPVLMVILIVAGCGGKIWQKTITITEEQIEEKLADKFPIDKASAWYEAHFDEPLVDLQPGSERVTFALSTTLDFMGETYSGTIMMSSGLEYKPNEGSFYLVDSQIEELEIENLDASKISNITTVLSQAVKFGLDKWPVYRLKQSDIKQQLAKTVLQSVIIYDGHIEAVIGI